MAKFREIIVKSINVESGSYLNIAGETKSITALDIYLVPKENGEHERYVADNNGLISKQSAEGRKLLPLSDSDGIPDNLSPYVSAIINKDNGIRFNQYDSYYGNNYQTSNFNFTKNGVNLSYSQLTDGSFQRSAGFTINPSGVLYFNVDKTNSQNYRTDQASITLNPETTTIKNTFYRGSTGIQKFLEFSYDGIKTDTLPNAEGDPTFTKQLVVKDDGTFGVTPKSARGLSAPTLYPKVNIIELTEDSGNFYIKVAVTNLVSNGFAGYPYFEVSSFGTLANDISVYTGNSGYTYTPFTMTNYPAFIITVPKASNNSYNWQREDILFVVTWLGTDNLDTQAGQISPYNPRRIASDARFKTDIIPKGIPYSGTTPSNPITGTLDFGTTGLNGRLIKGVAGSTFSSLQLGADGRVQITSQSNMDRTYVQLFSDKVQIWGTGTGSTMITAGFTGISLAAPLGKSLNVKGGGIDIQGLNNATGDPTFTRQLVQKEDGSVGFEPKTSVIERFYIEKSASISEYNVTADYLTLGFSLVLDSINMPIPTISMDFCAMTVIGAFSDNPNLIGNGRDFNDTILKWGYGRGIAHESGNKDIITINLKIPNISAKIEEIHNYGYTIISIMTLITVNIGGKSTKYTFQVPFK